MPSTSSATASASKNAKDNPKDIAYQTTRPGDLVIKPGAKTYGPSSTFASARDEINKHWSSALPKARRNWPLERSRPWRGHLVAVSLQGESRTPAILRVADVTDPDNGYGPELVLYVRIPRATANPLGLKACTRENARHFHLDNAAAKRLLCNLKISPFDGASACNGKAQHHPYALSLLISMHAIGDLHCPNLGELDANSKPVLACNDPAAFANGGLTVVCLPPLSAELEKCLILMGHSLAVGPLPKPPPAPATTSTNSDDAESTASDDVPLSNKLDPVWGNWQAKTAQAGNRFRACTHELRDLSNKYPLREGDSVLNYTVPLLSSRSSAVGQHILQPIMEHFAGAASSSKTATGGGGGGGKKSASAANGSSSSSSSSISSSISSAKPNASKPTTAVAAASTKAPQAKKTTPPPVAPAKRVTFAPTPSKEPVDDDDSSESWDVGETPVEPSPPPLANGGASGKRARDASGDKTRKTQARRGGRGSNDEGDLGDDDDEDFSDADMSSENEDDDDDDDSDDDSDDEDEEEEEGEGSAPPPPPVAVVARTREPAAAPDAAEKYERAVAELEAKDEALRGNMHEVAAQSYEHVRAWQRGERGPAMSEESTVRVNIDLGEIRGARSPMGIVAAMSNLVKTLTNAHAEHFKGETCEVPTIGTVAMPVGEVTRIRAMARDAHALGSETLPLVGDALRDVRALETSLVNFQRRGSEVLEAIASGIPAAPP